MLLLPLLATGCAVFITDEEYNERLQHTLSGELSIGADQIVPESGEVVLFALVPDPAEPIPSEFAVWASSPIDGLTPGASVSFSLEFPAAPDAELLADAAALGVTGGQVALFGLGVWSDADADGAMTDADTYIGMQAEQFIAWFSVSDEAGAAALEDIGASSGYNVAQYDLERQEVLDYDPVPSTKVSLDLDANLAPAPAGALGLRVVPAVEGANVRADLIHVLSVDDGEVESPTIASTELRDTGATQIVSFEGPFLSPPQEHLVTTFGTRAQDVDLSVWGLEGAAYVAAVYPDMDGDGLLNVDSIAEAPLGYSVEPTGGNLALYVSATGFDAVRAVTSFGALGWTLANVHPVDGLSLRSWSAGLTVEEFRGRQ